jgi:hypothetical protein
MQPRLTPFGRTFAGASFRVLCVLLVFASIIWMLIDTGHWNGVRDWVTSTVQNIDVSRRTLQWLGIVVPLFILASLRWKGFPKGILILGFVLLLLFFIVRTIADAAVDAHDAVLAKLHEMGEQDAALHPPGSRPDLRIHPTSLYKLNPFNDIPDAQTLVGTRAINQNPQSKPQPATPSQNSNGGQ